MVADTGAAVEIDRKQLGLANNLQIALFAQFLVQRLGQRFAALDPATRHVPAGHIGMTHQKHPALIVKRGGANAKRHAARERKPDMQHPGDKSGLPTAHFRRS